MIRSQGLPRVGAAFLVAWLIATVSRGAEPSPKAGAMRWFSEREIERSEAFHERGLWLSAVSLLAKVVLLFAVYAGRDRIRMALGLGGPRRWYVEAAAWALAAAVLLSLVTVATGAIEYSRHLAAGLTNQPARAWLLDMAKLRLRGITMTVLVTVGVYGCIGLLGRRWWWLGAFSLLVGIRVCSALLMSGRTSTLRYEYVPLERGQLRSHLESLATRSGQTLDGIKVARTSRISTRANAWIALFGNERHLVLTDTLIARYSPDEIGVMAAHELGHLRERIFAKRTAEAALRVLLGLGVAHFFLAAAARAPRRGFGAPEAAPLYLAAMILSGFLWGPVGNQLSKHSEASANRYALDLTRAPEAFISVQRRIAVENLSYIHPPRAIRLLFLGHPSPVEAIAQADSWANVHSRPSQP